MSNEASLNIGVMLSLIHCGAANERYGPINSKDIATAFGRMQWNSQLELDRK